MAETFVSQRAGLEFLFGRINYEKTRFPPRNRALKLDTTRELFKRLGNPHDSMKIVHIAGTKGKGSTAHMIASILSESGFRTGLYTSPHLIELEERFVVDQIRCLPIELDEILDEVIPIVKQLDEEAESETKHFNHPTFFEITTAVALLFFQKKKAEFAVLEVGLGGRRDSTNVCDTIASVITSISYDHQRQLGNTLSEIATEKAGIIKLQTPVVVGVSNPDVAKVIHEIALQQNAPVFQIGREFKIERISKSSRNPNSNRTSDASEAEASLRQRENFDFVFETKMRSGSATLQKENDSSPETEFRDVEVSMRGEHQAENAALAIQTSLILADSFKQIDEFSIRAGLKKCSIAGRIQVLSQNPMIVLDIAHNVASIAAFLKTTSELLHDSDPILIFASSRDKDSEGMLKLLLPKFRRMIATRFIENPRALPPTEIAKFAKSIIESENVDKSDNVHSSNEFEIQIAETPALAIEKSKQWAAAKPGPICVLGSVFLVGEVLNLEEFRSNNSF